MFCYILTNASQWGKKSKHKVGFLIIIVYFLVALNLLLNLLILTSPLCLESMSKSISMREHSR